MALDNATVLERLRAALPDAILGSTEFRGDLSVYVRPERIVDVARFSARRPGIAVQFPREPVRRRLSRS
jgi:NADH-quinone oxidoreductase subunit C